MPEPDITEHASAEDVRDTRFREGWDCAIAAIALDAARTHELPATLASVDDVRRVCEAAGLPSLRDIGVSVRWGADSRVEVVSTDLHDDGDGPMPVAIVHVLNREPGPVAFYPGSLAVALWHAIQAARSAS